MSSVNVKEKKAPIQTAGGGIATPAPHAAAQLRRLIMATMLWEDQYYESGQTTAQRIAELVPQVPAEVVAEFAVRAREDMKLRHVPLLLAREMARGPKEHRLLVAKTLEAIIQRADELTEFLAIYWKEKKQPLSAQVKKGLAKAFVKFGPYALAKYNRDGAVKLRDVLFLAHAKPKDAPLRRYTKIERVEERAGRLVRRKPMSDGEKLQLAVVNDTLPTPDTWETELSAGKDKKETFERLIVEDKLGALALLRNLRNMTQVNVDPGLIKMALEKADVSRVLPFRFIAAARAVPKLEAVLEATMFRATEQMPKLKGKTVLVVDTSGSMFAGRVSAKSDLTRVDAATALAIMARELCEEVVIYATAGSDGAQKHATALVPPRRGFGLGDAIFGDAMRRKLGSGGIFLKQCMDYVSEQEKVADRVIVFTDEADTDQKANPKHAVPLGRFNYIVNVASYRNGVAYGTWNKIDGFSEAVLRYIAEFEAEEPKP